MKKNEFLLIILACILPYTVLADNFLDDEKIAIHPKAGIYYNIYQADFDSFTNAISCDGITYKNGHGFGYGLGIALERSFGSRFQLSFGLNYVKRSGSLYDDFKYSYRDDDMQIKKATVRSQIDAALYYLELQPDMRYVLVDNLINGPFRAYAGIRCNIAAINEFEQYETVISPNDVYFKNNFNKKSRTRDLASGKIGDINRIGLGCSIGFDNLLKVSDRIHWTQQIGFDYNFTDVAQNVDWKTHALHFSMGLRFSIGNDKPYFGDTVEVAELPEEKAPEPVQRVVPPNLIIEPAGFDGVIYTGTELLATKPVVNAVFFDNNSAEVPNYIKYEYLTIDDYYYMDALKQHDHILPRIAAILKANPTASVTLEGATAGAQFEPKGVELAKERAANIKQIFINLGIDATRIKTAARTMPRYPSNNKHKEGVMENQRVDIWLHNAQLQEYVDFLRFAELDGQLQYEAAIINSSDTGSLYSTIADTSVKAAGSGVYGFKIKKRLKENERFLYGEAILSLHNYHKSVDDTLNTSVLDTVNVEKIYDRFEAILRFDYNSDILSNENKHLLKQLVDKLPEGYTIQILGSADALGSDARNQQLSNRRAAVTRDYINSLKKDKFKFETGINNNPVKISEATPQGRFLNRCMTLRIKK